MRMFRLLEADEIECRISGTNKTDKIGHVKLLLYKTARTDAALLDETVEPYNWQCDYRTIDGKMYCGIGIRDPGSGDWIWKWNVGTESNQEAEKGQASDALKRSGFVWGLGTELYTAPDITIWEPNVTIKETNGKLRCYDRFKVSEIGYNEREQINKLVIVNEKTGAAVFTMGAPKTKAVPKPETPPIDPYAETTPRDYKRLSTPITDDQLRFLFDAVERHPDVAEYIRDKYEGASNMTAAQAQRVIDRIREKDNASQTT